MSLIEQLYDQYVTPHQLVDTCCDLDLPDFPIRIQSNSAELIAQLRQYFKDYCGNITGNACTVIAIDDATIDIDAPWQDWAREAGKQGRKDSYVDHEVGRVLRKVRTGMVFIQHPHHRVALGPCHNNLNQVVNFINNQYMNFLQQHDWLIGHAAAIGNNRGALAIAGFSGGGKSTAMLHLLAQPGWRFISNDRVFFKRDSAGHIQLRGIPKLPRVNPGTIVHNARLHRLCNSEQRQRYLHMSAEELWTLEDKYDVDVTSCFGPDHIRQSGTLKHLVLLNWSHMHTDPCIISHASFPTAQNILPAVMKSPGPFYHDAAGNFYPNQMAIDPEPYRELFADTDFITTSGGVDFDQLQAVCMEALS